MIDAPSPEAVAIAQTYGLWIQTGAIVISALAAMLIVAVTRATARRRATLDVLLEDQANARLAESRRRFIEIRDQGHLVQWLAPERGASAEAQYIREQLNRYELIAIGIRNGTVDKNLYRMWFRTTFVRDWISVKPFVIQLRHDTGNEKYFCEFERLAKKFARNDERSRV